MAGPGDVSLLRVAMSMAHWLLFGGVLLITMVLVRTALARVPPTTVVLYLCLGYALGPGGMGVITPDPLIHPGTLEVAAEVALLISLFAVGLKLGVPILDRRWYMPLRLAFPAMAMTVALVAAVGVLGLGLSLGEAVLLGGILAPTDPVLAASVQSDTGPHLDRVRFNLAGEGALNDGSAFPFVLLGLGLMGLHPLGEGGWRWWVVDLVWASAGGLLIGATLGAFIGKLVIHLRTRYHSAVGLDEFLSLGLIGVSYGAALLCLASGFLAVFAAGLAVRRVREQPQADAALPGTWPPMPTETPVQLATHSLHASASMNRAVQGFNEQLENFAELAIVLIVGAMLPYVTMQTSLWWFIPVLFFILRPAAVFLGTLGAQLPRREEALIGWFGIRGIGSVFYLMYALRSGVEAPLAQDLLSITLATVVASILGHGLSARPLMRWYAKGTVRGT